MRILFGLLLFASTACSAETPGPGELRAQRLSDLKVVTEKCGLPQDTLKLVGTDKLHIQLRADTDFSRTECMLEELRKLPYPLDMGFTGNEAPFEAEE